MGEPNGRWRPSLAFRVSAGVHLAAAATLVAAPAAWPLVGGGLVLNHAVLCVAGMLPRSRLLGPNLTRLPPDAERRRHVALTFDDGPDPEVTPAVLDLLAERGATASFFVIGRRADRHPDLVAEIVRRGHLVENHTYNHSNAFAFFGPRTQSREIDRAQESVERAAGRRPVYVRAPAGIRNPWLDLVLSRRRLTLASWTRRGYDTVDGDARRVIRRLLRGLAAGDVLVFHDGSVARDRRGRPVVLETLPRVLDAMDEGGLRSVPLPDGRS